MLARWAALGTCAYTPRSLTEGHQCWGGFPALARPGVIVAEANTGASGRIYAASASATVKE